MNPSKFQKSEIESTSKIAKYAYIQPGFLARGRGQSLRTLGSLRVTAEQRTQIGKSESCNAATTTHNKLAQKKILMNPSFVPMEGDVPPRQETEVIQDALRSEMSPGELEKAKKVKGKNISKNVAGSKHGETIQNKLSQKISFVPPSVDSMEGDVHPQQEGEVTHNARRSEMRGPGELEKAKKVNGKNTSENVKRPKHGETIQNKLTQKISFVPSGFDPLEGDVHPQQEDLFESEKTKKVRGKNLCKNVARLKPGEKLEVTFYHNRVVGDNHASFTRHLGLLVRDSNMCPMRVHSWRDIEEYKLEHMWEAVKEKFHSDDMNDQKDHVLQHMRKLWTNWRGSLHKNVKSKPLHKVLKDVPQGVSKSDWDWLVKEHFLSDKFKEASTRNSANRSKLRMPHRTGSKPIREIIYDLGGKVGKPPDMATIFFETRKKDEKLVEPETNEKYAELQELVQSEPSLSHIEVVERCFGPQRKSHAIGFGGGITAKELKGGNSSKAALLDELKACRKEKESLQKRVDIIERRQEWFESILLREHSSAASSSEQTVD